MLKKTVFPSALIWLCLGISVASASNHPLPVGNAHLTANDLNHVTEGDASLLEKNNQLLISAINATAIKTSITLQTADKSKTVSVAIFPSILKTTDIKVGQTVQLTKNTVGTEIFIKKQMIAFVPNESGKKLFYSYPRD